MSDEFHTSVVLHEGPESPETFFQNSSNSMSWSPITDIQAGEASDKESDEEPKEGKVRLGVHLRNLRLANPRNHIEH